ncbi:hypothetical protein XH84_06055 [Bradyrhizobium nanningense]|nr:hypothetical protein XH84_06055 [Bradyrhizobium nanningense]
MQACRIDNPAPGCAKEFTAALLLNVDENHPPALDERGMFEAPQLFCRPVASDEWSEGQNVIRAEALRRNVADGRPPLSLAQCGRS